MGCTTSWLDHMQRVHTILTSDAFLKCQLQHGAGKVCHLSHRTGSRCRFPRHSIVKDLQLHQAPTIFNLHACLLVLWNKTVVSTWATRKTQNILLLNTGPLSRTASPATHEKQANHWLTPQPPTQRRGPPANGSAWRSSWARLHKMAFEDRRINDTWCRKDATYLRMRSLDVGRLDGKSWYYASQNYIKIYNLL